MRVNSIIKVLPVMLSLIGGTSKSMAISLKQPSLKKRNTETSPLQSSTNCRSILHHFEKQYGIPEYLLTSIAVVESRARPFAINALGKAKYFNNKKDAVAYVKSLRQQGVTNIGVGCMQIDLRTHGKHFKTLEDALDPFINIAYGARFFNELKTRFGSWENAVRYYHSANEVHNGPYRARVYRAWARVKGEPVDSPAPKLASFKVGVGPGVGMPKKESITE